LYDDAPLSSYVDIVLARWRLVLGIAAGVFLLGLLYAVFATPVYRVDATIQVNESTAAGNSPLHDIAALLDNGSTTAAELELVRARMVIDAVVTKQHLNLVAEPRYVPLIGRWVARRYRGEGIAPPLGACRASRGAASGSTSRRSRRPARRATTASMRWTGCGSP
jgi:tyrosine-protein kinase Etk/Wzc